MHAEVIDRLQLQIRVAGSLGVLGQDVTSLRGAALGKYEKGSLLETRRGALFRRSLTAGIARSGAVSTRPFKAMSLSSSSF